MYKEERRKEGNKEINKDGREESGKKEEGKKEINGNKNK